MTRIRLLLFHIVILITVGTSSAAEFISLGELPGGEIRSWATGVSDDGTVVVGVSKSEIEGGEDFYPNSEAFRWTQETGLIGLDFNPGAGTSISGDGLTIIGGHFGTGGGMIHTESEGLEPLSADSNFGARGISFDGSVLAGTDYGNGWQRAFRWTQEDGFTFPAFQRVEPNGFWGSRASDVSDDGFVIVGQIMLSNRNDSDDYESFRWTRETGIVALGHLPGLPVGARRNDYPGALSPDGSVIVGTSSEQAFRWSAESGMVSLDPLDESSVRSSATGVTEDGNTIVGYSWNNLGEYDAFIWTSQDGTRNLQQVLVEDYGLVDSLSEWQQIWVSDISPDGNFMVGGGVNSAGNTEAFLVRLSPSEPFTINGGGETYLELFDSIGIGKSMPKGWKGDTGEGFTPRTMSLGLVDGPLAGPLDGSDGTAAGLLNLGGNAENFEGSANHLATWQRDLVSDSVLNGADLIADAAEDRALGIGRVNENDPGILQFEIPIADAPLRAFTLDWDLEVWGGDPDTKFRGADGGGFAAELTVGGETYYEATVSHKPGELFYSDFDGANTNRNTTLIDGNLHSIRGNMSGIVEVNAIDGAVGNTINLTFDANYGNNDKGWISAIDNVQLRALAAGDADANGTVDVQDLLTLLGGQKFNKGVDDVTWAQGDFNADDQFNTGDLLAMLAYLSGTFPSDPYASEAGSTTDEMADVIVNSVTGEITVDLAGHTASAILIESAAEIFNGTQPDWDTTSQFPSTLPGELGNVLFTSTASGIDKLGVMISNEFLGRDKEFYLQDLDLNILIASEGGALTKGNVIVVPEPSTWLLLLTGTLLGKEQRDAVPASSEARRNMHWLASSQWHPGHQRELPAATALPLDRSIHHVYLFPTNLFSSRET